jgi:hypothetical protein
VEPSGVHVSEADSRYASCQMSGSPARKRDPVIRFAVGSPEAPYSAVWRLFTKGNDVFVSGRLMGRYLKISLHASGVWRLAWTEESQILANGTNDRVIHRWRRPPQFRPGWTRGISIVVPWTPIGRHFRAVDAPAGKPVQWLRAPAPGYKVVFTVLYAAPDRPKGAWEWIREPGDRSLGRLLLPNGENVYVAVRRARLDSIEKAEAEKLAGELRLHLAADASPENIQGASAMVWFNSKEDGSPIILNASLGPGNLTQPRADTS